MPPIAPPPDLLPLCAAVSVSLIAAATDLRRFKVYNVLTIPALIGGLVASAWLGGWGGLGTSLLGVAVGFGVLVVFFALGGVGAGDVKLFAALGAWLGPWLTFEVFLASSLAAGAYALVLVVLEGGTTLAYIRVGGLARRMRDPAAWSLPADRIDREVARPDRRRRLVPFAATTFVGVVATLVYSHIEGPGRAGVGWVASAGAMPGGVDR